MSTPIDPTKIEQVDLSRLMSMYVSALCYAASSRRENTDEFMEGLVEQLNAINELSQSTLRFKYDPVSGSISTNEPLVLKEH